MTYRPLLNSGMFHVNFWRTFGLRLLGIFYKDTQFRYDFGFGYQDVRNVCKHHKNDAKTKIELLALIQKHNLKREDRDETMRAIMNWVNTTYPSSIYYVIDKGDRWNTPRETLESWRNRKRIRDENPDVPTHQIDDRRDWKQELPTDCDDYSILMYNMARVAGIPAENMYLTFMKTISEWHMNIMYFDKEDVPYAIEGTYYPTLAMRRYKRVPYFENVIIRNNGRQHYYEFVRWLFNEDKVRYNPHVRRTRR